MNEEKVLTSIIIMMFALMIVLCCKDEISKDKNPKTKYECFNNAIEHCYSLPKKETQACLNIILENYNMKAEGDVE